MNVSDISLLVIAAVPILYRGWAGWRYGATFEIRQLLMIFFGVLVAIRYWEPCTIKLIDAINFDPRWVAIGAFVMVFSVSAVVAGFIVNVKAKVFQSVKPNYFDNVLGLAAGLFSGALLGACLIWLATVAVPGKFASDTYVQSFLDLPRDILQAIETRVGVAPDSTGRTRYPKVSLVEVPVEPGTADVPEGVVLMRQRGKIAWK